MSKSSMKKNKFRDQSLCWHTDSLGKLLWRNNNDKPCDWGCKGMRLRRASTRTWVLYMTPSLHRFLALRMEDAPMLLCPMRGWTTVCLVSKKLLWFLFICIYLPISAYFTLFVWWYIICTVFFAIPTYIIHNTLYIHTRSLLSAEPEKCGSGYLQAISHGVETWMIQPGSQNAGENP